MNIAESIIGQGKDIITEYNAKKILSYYNIPTVKEILVRGLDKAINAAEEIGYPVVLKGYSTTVAHKSEYGIIEINLKNKNELKDAYYRIINNSKIKIEDMLVQEYIRGDIELIIGLKQDPTFGHFIVFGLGGMFTEVLEDISIRVIPFERYDAINMIKEIKGYKILEGYRGKEGVNIDTLCEILLSVGKISCDFPQIKEMDINPLIVKNGIPIAVDALIMLNN